MKQGYHQYKVYATGFSIVTVVVTASGVTKAKIVINFFPNIFFLDFSV